MIQNKEVNYSDYLQLEKLLGAQIPESDAFKIDAHDEMLFIIIHQAYELWFKQVGYELDSVIDDLNAPMVNDNTPAIQTAVHRMNRIAVILRVLVHQIDILETMTPLDFLDFRDLLRPASGFQSWQFKIIEARLGLPFLHRHGKEYYTSQLRPHQVQMIKDAEAKPTLIQLINSWLERFPYFENEKLWKNFDAKNAKEDGRHVFWSEYKSTYASTLLEVEKGNLQSFETLFFDGEEDNAFSPKANRAALFIMLYRGYPLLQQPYQLLNLLLEIDEQLSTWRFRHVNMVHRMIGSRVGTGGSTGKDYLQGALQKHYIFKDVSKLTSFLTPRRNIPQLSMELQSALGFSI